MHIYWYIFVEILHVRHCSGYWAYSYEWTKVLPSWSLYSRKSINIDGKRSYSILGYEIHKGLWVQSNPGWVPLSSCLKLFSCGGHAQLRGWKLLASPFPKRTWWLTDATLSSQLPLDMSAGATADFCSLSMAADGAGMSPQPDLFPNRECNVQGILASPT